MGFSGSRRGEHASSPSQPSPGRSAHKLWVNSGESQTPSGEQCITHRSATAPDTLPHPDNFTSQIVLRSVHVSAFPRIQPGLSTLQLAPTWFLLYPGSLSAVTPLGSQRGAFKLQARLCCSAQNPPPLQTQHVAMRPLISVSPRSLLPHHIHFQWVSQLCPVASGHATFARDVPSDWDTLLTPACDLGFLKPRVLSPIMLPSTPKAQPVPLSRKEATQCSDHKH